MWHIPLTEVVELKSVIAGISQIQTDSKTSLPTWGQLQVRPTNAIGGLTTMPATNQIIVGGLPQRKMLIIGEPTLTTKERNNGR